MLLQVLYQVVAQVFVKLKPMLKPKSLIAGAAVLLLPLLTLAQPKTTFQEITIKQVQIADTFLVSQLEKIIKQEEQSDTLFAKGVGYLMLSPRDMGEIKVLHEGNHHLSNVPDTVSAFYIGVSFMSLDKSENRFDNLYAPYYAFVGGRIILIGLHSKFIQYSEKSKRKLRRKIEPFLEKPVETKRIVNGKETIVKDLKSRTVMKFFEEYRIFYTKYPLTDNYLPPIVDKKVWP